MSVLKWIDNFKPTSINLQDSMMPSELYETSEHTKLILSDIENKTPLGYLNSHKSTISTSLFGELQKQNTSKTLIPQENSQSIYQSGVSLIDGLRSENKRDGPYFSQMSQHTAENQGRRLSVIDSQTSAQNPMESTQDESAQIASQIQSMAQAFAKKQKG